MSWHPPRSTKEVVLPTDPLERIVGQEAALRIVRLALRRRAHLLLIGPPGTGKSMLGAAYAHHAPRSPTEDVVLRSNHQRSVEPLVELHPSGQASRALERERRHHARAALEKRVISLTGGALLAGTAWWWGMQGNTPALAACTLGALASIHAAWRAQASAPQARLLITASEGRAPFVDATGFHESALLGDVRHDPHQSGAGRTPPHELVEPGAIHQAHGGILFIDEASTLSQETQQRLLSALQNKRLPIVGRSTGSSGAMIRTAPLPCHVALVLAGTEEEIAMLHPGLRSRIRGYGYEVRMASTMPDTSPNRDALVRFAAQELADDPDAPSCDAGGLHALITHAAAMSGRPKALTLRLRELGGIVRSAADIAAEYGAPIIGQEHVREAVSVSETQRKLCGLFAHEGHPQLGQHPRQGSPLLGAQLRLDAIEGLSGDVNGDLRRS